MALFHTTVVDNQIKALDTIGTATGSIATFDTDRAENLINLEVAITATGGGGTPVSPIAINGFSEMNVAHIGSNLWSGGDVTFTAQTKEVAISLTPNTYYFSAIITTTDTDANTCSLVVYYTDNTYIAVTGLARDKRIFTSFTATKDIAKLAFYSSDNYAHGAGDTATWSDIQISVNGTTETIPFGQTVYGGSLNVGSGVLTVTHGIVICDGTESWNEFLSGKYFAPVITPNTNKVNGTGYITNIYVFNGNGNTQSTNVTIDNSVYMQASYGRVWIYDSNITSLANLQTLLSNTNLQVVYPLETPLTIQLDSKQIQAIIGTNNIYADTGDIIDLKFVLTVGKAIS